MPLHTNHTHSLPVMGERNMVFSLDYVVYDNVGHYVVVDECGTCSQLGVTKLSISHSSRAFHPVTLLITTCVDMYYITIHNTLIPCVCVCVLDYTLLRTCAPYHFVP